MKLIVGLGNPGDKYAKTRHNIGFEVINKLQKDLNIIGEKDKFQGLLSEKNIDGEKVLFLKPQTFMNLSGNSIAAVINFYKIDAKNDMIVIYDDMDLPVGKLRVKEKGSSGGHNGIKSIISHLGDEFLRIKCGIGKSKDDTIDFVLGQFDKSEQETVDKMIENASNCALDLVRDVELGRIMQKYNKK
ncbi:aminoacyl-tRNA hydrolase [Fusobacterium ulcerans]|jgi:PTH1 family peptidyl-tRNA hydrolase|uniref:Peptidyl-tRNA hydrolase n=1 Tax=Fusobacterium ulcerans TaxID=861 RepID=A0AAX2JGN9_9FUSO|nr:aminoacyl-tRNA hydrolase [Fusobacterium ulcerans]AVQ27675.1 aminoacyl-tRNA hydrolase [Fusobacterium ulcerans]EFS27151.1 peptidyl-tRNA hydrolase [Fusobacterium ulcerans ATCC 49185]MEE0138878.1 aminoacyl-tRNA hydrolase [Fusobacterium ulcerans]SQJ15777.1 Peptidyl-tRNA hydrolase [Fusobacterium ulcerans]